VRNLNYNDLPEMKAGVVFGPQSVSDLGFAGTEAIFVSPRGPVSLQQAS
jgi:hypothetical protein